LSFQSFPDGTFVALRFGGVKSDTQQSGCGTKQTSRHSHPMSAFGSKADMSRSRLLPCKMTPEPHFAGRKSLL
jgi:hypothetical protein